MTDIRSLEPKLFDNLPWNKTRIKFVARFLLALYAMRTVNLSILATAFSCQAKEESNYKRHQRFMREFEMPRTAFYQSHSTPKHERKEEAKRASSQTDSDARKSDPLALRPVATSDVRLRAPYGFVCMNLHQYIRGLLGTGFVSDCIPAASRRNS